MDGRRHIGAAGEAIAAANPSDQRLLETLLARLRNDDGLDASRLDAEVSGGHVTLTGDVADRWMKQRAEDIVDACDGAISLQNRIRVKPREPRPSSADGRFHSPDHGDEQDQGPVPRRRPEKGEPVRPDPRGAPHGPPHGQPPAHLPSGSRRHFPRNTHDKES